MRKVISFCVWGKKKIYNYGIYENALLLPKIFPEWKMVVYHTKTANLEVMKKLSEMKDVEVIEVDFPNHFRNSMLRFMAGFNPNNDVVIFRDADSRLLKRDFIMVNEWLKTDKPVHIIRDHPANGKLYRISAGMWGVQKNFLLSNNIEKDYTNHFVNFKNTYRFDEIFLFKYIYSLVNENNSVIHSQYNKWENWSVKFTINIYNFIGKTYLNTPNASKYFNDDQIIQNKYKI